MDYVGTEMKILQISSAKSFGGGEQHLIDLCRGLHERGHDIYVAIRPTCEWKDKLSFLPTENILLVSIRNSFGLLSSKRIANFVRKNNIQIIHAHLGRDYITGSIVTRLVDGTRCIFTRHVLFPLKSFNKLILTNVSRIIAVSEDVRFSLSGIFETRRVTVIHNGTNTPAPSDEIVAIKRRQLIQKLDLNPEDRLIGVVGTLSKIKGQQTAMEAIALLTDQRNLKLLIIGSDDNPNQQTLNDLRNVRERLGLLDQVLFIPTVEDVPSVISGLDILLSSSTTESFGLAMLEAMALRVPVVATRTRGAVLLLDNGKCGYLAKVGDVKEIAGKIKECISDVGRTKQHVELAAERVKELFNLKQMIQKTENVYLESLR